MKHKPKMTGEIWYGRFEKELKVIAKNISIQKFESTGELIIWVLDEIELAAQRVSKL